MARVTIGMRTSLDGFVADASGDSSPLYPDLEGIAENAVVREAIERTGAVILGRNSYDMADEDLTGYEFQVPIFVLTHHPPNRGPKGENEDLTVTFVSEGIERAVELAKAAAGDLDVTVIGADVCRQALRAGLVDDVQVGIVPVLFGRGKRLFEDGGTDRIELERVRVIETDVDTDIRFRVRGGQRGPL